MDFTLVQLEHFVAVATAGSMTRAAEELHLSQSAISASLTKLERSLQADLFVRAPARPIVLSPAGRQFLADARNLLRVAREVNERGRGIGSHGALTIGCFLPLAPVCVPQAVAAARRAGRATVIRTIEGTTTELQRSLHAGECELVVSYQLSALADLEFAEVGQVHPHAIVAPDHPVAGRSSVTLQELAQYPWVMYSPEHPTQQLMEFMFLHEGVSPPVSTPIAGYETMRGLVAAGEGFALLTVRPASNVTFTGLPVVPVELRGEPIPLRLGLFTLPGSTTTRRARDFSVHLRAVLAGLVARDRAARRRAGLTGPDGPSDEPMTAIE